MNLLGPLGDPVIASFGINVESGIAVVESALACGLYLVPKEKRNPMNTTTRGVGELIKAAIAAGAKKIVMGVGGSATNDGAWCYKCAWSLVNVPCVLM